MTLPRQPCGTPSTWRKTPQRRMMVMVMEATWRMPWRQGGAVWRCWMRRVGRDRPERLTLPVRCQVEWQVADGSWRARTGMSALVGM